MPTPGGHLTRRTKSACGGPRDRNYWNIYCHVSLRLFLLRRGIELLCAFVRSRREGSLLRAYGGWQTHVPAARGIVGTSVPLTWVPMYTAGKVAGGVRRPHSLHGALGSSAPTILMPRMGPSGTVQGLEVPCDPRLRESHLDLPSSVSRTPGR